jgi:hypothetical protein
MSSASEKIQDYYSLHRRYFGAGVARILKKLEWTTATPERGYASHLTLHMASAQDRESELILQFEDVRSFRFSAPGLVQPHLEVKDVSSQQWDGVIYEFRDDEHDTLFFLCRDFHVSIQNGVN